MNDLRVPTNRQPVTLTCTDGRDVDGDIFMPDHSSRHAGAMRLDEWADTKPAFFPFRARDAVNATIFNLRAVVAITMRVEGSVAEAELRAAERLDVPIVRVAVDTSHASFEGNVIIDTPPDRKRIADWLNAPALFVTVRAGTLHHLVQKRHITRVVEVS